MTDPMKKRMKNSDRFLVFAAVSLVAASACTLDREHEDRVRVRIDVGAAEETGEKGAFIPGGAAGFDCLAVNIVGQGIPAPAFFNNIGAKPISAILGGSPCAYPGVVSPLRPMSGGGSFELDVPAGPDRVVQILGIRTKNAAIGCPAGADGRKTFIEVYETENGEESFPGVYELGRVRTDLFTSRDLVVPNQFDPERPKSVTRCGELKLVEGYTQFVYAAATPMANDTKYAATGLQTLVSAGTYADLTPIPAVSLDRLNYPGQPTPVNHDVTATTASSRMDLLYSLEGVPLSGISALRVDLKGSAYLSATTCGVVTTSQLGLGFTSSGGLFPGWDPRALSPFASQRTEIAFTGITGFARTHPLVNGGRPFAHLTLRAPAVTGGDHSCLSLEFARLRAIYP